MNINFLAMGLEFDAEVDYEPYRPAQLYGPPENCSPAEGGTAEITALRCGKFDALFLLDGDSADELNDAAYDACIAHEQYERESAAEARAEDRAERYA